MEINVESLIGRIEAEFAKSRDNLEKLRRQKVEAHQGRVEGLVLFDKACESLNRVWIPRLEALQRRFGENVSVIPRMSTGLRQATFDFTSSLARISLSFTATTDHDARNLVLEYSLSILPVLMAFPDKALLEQPLDQLDADAIGAWIDDRILDFVKTYLSLHENEYYLKAHMVEDPVARVRFPKFAAAATLVRNDKTVYFIANETRDEFERNESKKPARESAGD